MQNKVYKLLYKYTTAHRGGWCEGCISVVVGNGSWQDLHEVIVPDITIRWYISFSEDLVD